VPARETCVEEEENKKKNCRRKLEKGEATNNFEAEYAMNMWTKNICSWSLHHTNHSDDSTARVISVILTIEAIYMGFTWFRNKYRLFPQRNFCNEVAKWLNII
jgi:hypothetical protein